MPNWVDIVVVVLEREMFKSRNFVIISLLQRSTVLHLLHISSIDPNGILCVNLVEIVPVVLHCEKFTTTKKKTTMPGN